MSGGSLLVLTVVQLVLTAAPGVASVTVAVRFGVRRVPVLLGVALAGSGVSAILAFWAYFLDPNLGGPCAYLIFFGSIALAVWSWPALRGRRNLLRELSVPLALWALGSTFIVFFGFLHGGTEAALETAAARFSAQPNQLASDNFIPTAFSEWVFNGSPGQAPIFEPGWHFSDRPPLQVGYTMAQRIFGWDLGTLHAELLGVKVQQLWIVGLWAVLCAARVSRRTAAMAMVAALVSDVAIVNGFYVWPKLLAAAFVLAALALVVGEPRAFRNRLVTAPLFGALFGLAFLSHGSSVFGLFPVLLLLLVRGLPDWRWLLAAAAAALILVVPWTAYQRYGDPPGNRVVKWGLAGVTEIDDRGTAEAVVDAYREAGPSGTLENKLQNFLTMAGGGPGDDVAGLEWIRFGSAFTDTRRAVEAVGEGRFRSAVSLVRRSRFSPLLWSFGFLLLAIPVIAVARLRGQRPRGPDWDLARVCFFVVGVGAVAWGLIMFGNVPGRAIVISGSLALPLLGIVGLVAGLRGVAPRWADWLVTLNVVTVLLLYGPALDPRPGTSYEIFPALAAALALAGFAAVALADPRRPPRGSLSSSRKSAEK